MYGITSKTATVIVIAGLALGISAIAIPAAAGDRGGHGRGHHSFGKSHGFHGGQKHRRAFKKHGHRKHSFKRHGHREHGFKRHGHRFKKRGFKKHGFKFKKHGYKKGYRKGYRHGYSKGHKRIYKYGRRYNHSYWRKHGRHGVTVYGWKSHGHRSAYPNYRLGASCHPIVGHGRDHFGRRAKFGGTMCYDHYGRGYVVAGSRHVIRYY